MWKRLTARSRRSLLGLLALAVMAAALVAVREVRSDAFEADTPPPPSPISVILGAPSGAVTPGTKVTLTVEVVSSKPLGSVELWEEDRVADRAEVKGETRAIALDLTWTPPAEGAFILTARAVDRRGAVGHSGSVRVRAAAPLGRDGEPLPIAPPDPADIATVPPRGGTGHLSMQPPMLSLSTQGCSVVASFGGDTLGAAGVALYRLDASARGFSLMATLPPGSSAERVFELPGGRHLFYASSYRGANSSETPIVAATLPIGCTTRSWTGEVSIVDGTLRAPELPPVAYLYISVDDGPWMRIPEEDGTFVSLQGGELDFGSVLPVIDGRRVAVEAWTHDGEKPRLLGKGELDAGGGDPGALIGASPGTELGWVTLGPTPAPEVPRPEILLHRGEMSLWKPDSGYYQLNYRPPLRPYRFRWLHQRPEITHGLWQVTLVPAGGALSLNPPTLVAWGEIPSGETDFSIDLGVLLGVYPPGPDGPQMPETALSAEAVSLDQATGSAAPGGMATQPHLPAWLRALSPSELHVRVLPMAGSQPVDAVSNPVVFGLQWNDPDPPKQPPTIGAPAWDVSVEFDRPYMPNPRYEHCVRVVQNPFATKQKPGRNPDPFAASVLASHDPLTDVLVEHVRPKAHVGATICAFFPKEDDSGLLGYFDAVIGFVGLYVEVWDKLADTFNSLKKEVVDEIVKVTGCADRPELKDACTFVVTQAANAALAFAGIPPTIPTTKEVSAAARGELSEAVLLQAEAHGYRCEGARDACKETLDKILGEIQRRIKLEVSAGAHAHAGSGGRVLPVHPDIVVVPEPRAQLQPAVFAVRFTRTANPLPEPTTRCWARVLVSSEIEDRWKIHSLAEREPQSGWPLEGGKTRMELPDVPAGTTVEWVTSLHRLSGWFESGAVLPWHYDETIGDYERHQTHAFALLSTPYRVPTTKEDPFASVTVTAGVYPSDDLVRLEDPLIPGNVGPDAPSPCFERWEIPWQVESKDGRWGGWED